MADLKTTLTLNDRNFTARLDTACKKAKTSLNSVNSVTKQFGSVMKGLTPILGTLGVSFGGASAAGAIFNEMMNNSQALGDEVKRAQTQAAGAVDYFAQCMAQADFSNFIQGLRTSILESGKLADILDTLSTTAQQLGVIDARAEKKKNEARLKYYKATTKAEKQQAVREMQEADKERRAAHEQFGELNLKGARQTIRANIKGVKMSDKDIDAYFDNFKKFEQIGKETGKQYQKNKATIESINAKANSGHNITKKEVALVEKARKDNEKIRNSKAYGYYQMTQMQDKDEKSPMSQAYKMMTQYYQEAANNAREEVNTARMAARAEKFKEGGSGGGSKGGGSKGGGRTTTIKPEKAPEYAAGSLEDLRAQQQQLMNDFTKGLYTGTVDAFWKAYNDAGDKIKDKEIELKLAPEEGSVQYWENKISELDEKAMSGRLEPNIDYRKTRKEFEENMESAKIVAKIELPPNEIQLIDKELEELDERQLNIETRLDREAYIKARKELEGQKFTWQVNIGFRDDPAELQKEIDNLIKDYNYKSSFEIAVGVEIPQGGEGLLNYYKQVMDKNDAMVQNLERLKTDTESWGKAGITSLEQINSLQAKYNQENQEIGEKAQGLDAIITKNKKISTGFSVAADAANNLGSVLSAAGAEEAGAIAGIAGTIASTIGSVIALMTANGVKSAMALPFPANLAAAATVIAGLATIIGQIKAAMGGSFASGGIVGGGKYYGDKNIVNVDSGEIIMNRTQQARLWRILNGNEYLAGQPVGSGHVEFKIRGADLYGSLENYKKITKK